MTLLLSVWTVPMTLLSICLSCSSHLCSQWSERHQNGMTQVLCAASLVERRWWQNGGGLTQSALSTSKSCCASLRDQLGAFLEEWEVSYHYTYLTYKVVHQIRDL